MANEEIPKKLDALYSQISRLYSSAINMLAALIFGWLSFIGFAIGKLNCLEKLSVAFPIYALVFYIAYFRVLRHGRFIFQIETDLGFRGYVTTHLLPLDETLPIKKLARFFFRNRRFGQRENPQRMSPEEKWLCILLAVFFSLTSVILFLKK